MQYLGGMMDKKIIISVLAGGGKHYHEMEAAARETCFKDPPENISVYYVHNRRPDVPLDDGDSVLIEDRFHYGGPNGVRNCLRKCVEFWGYCLENFEFDYIFRPNLGCWVSMDALNRLVDKLPNEGVYGGAFGIHKHMHFISGSGFLLSKDLVQMIWDRRLNDQHITIEYDGNIKIDDVAIGAFFGGIDYDSREPDVKITKLPRIDLHESEICPSRVDLDCHHYYFLHPKSPNCYYKMQEAIQSRVRMSQVNKNVAFVICHKDAGNMIFDCVSSIRKYHPESTIIMVDSDSKDKSCFKELREKNVIIEDVKNKNYVTGAWVHAFKRYNQNFDAFVFLHDSQVLTSHIKLSELNESNAISFHAAYSGWAADPEARREAYNLHEGVGRIPSLPDSNQIVTYGTFCIKSDLMRKVLNSNYFKNWNLPVCKKGCRAWERIWSIIFHQNNIEVLSRDVIKKHFLNRQ